MFQLFYQCLIELTNRKWTSHLLKKFARSKVSRIVIPSFSKTYKINLAEMEKGISEYSTLHEFFTRKLQAGKRIIDEEVGSVTSPVDGVIEDIGSINENHVITVKGKTYSISEMVGKDEILNDYRNGIYMIIYLSPSHYHRIHSPINGSIVDQWTIGNRSYPVNKYGLSYGKSPLSKNFRTITEIKHTLGNLLLVKVGAMFVNSIETVHEGDRLEKGEELAYFSFGSTVILLFEKDSFTPKVSETPLEVKVGEVIGYIK